MPRLRLELSDRLTFFKVTRWWRVKKSHEDTPLRIIKLVAWPEFFQLWASSQGSLLLFPFREEEEVHFMNE